MRYEELTMGGYNAMLEAFRSDRAIDKLFILDGYQDDPAHTILRETRKYDTIVNYAPRERLDQTSEAGEHQGVIAYATAYEYAGVEDVLEAAEKKGEPPLLVLLDGIEDSHNLGAIIRTTNLARTHGVITPKRRAAGLAVTVVETSAGALNYTSVAKVTNLTATMEDLRKKGMWFIYTDMGRELMYKMNLKGSTGLVVGNEGEGAGKLVCEYYDMIASIPIKGDIDSLNTSVTTGVLAYETVRRRLEIQPF